MLRADTEMYYKKILIKVLQMKSYKRTQKMVCVHSETLWYSCFSVDSQLK